MTIKSTDYALLARESYEKPVLEQKVVLDGVTYKVIDSAKNTATGFQATAYQRLDTDEIVVAMRGTEKAVTDIATDAGMVLNRANAQVPDALAFTKRVMEKAHGASVTVTGHSLGGTLAEVAASKYGLKGETFNAYGAASLRGVPQGGHQVINHVRAGDPVSAASPHFGEVRVYAAQKDIDTLGKASYRDDGGILSSRNPAKALDFSTHGIDNFVPNSTTLGKSIIAPENEARYRAHQGMVDRFRNDVHGARLAANVALGPTMGPALAAGQGAAVAGQAIVHGAKAVGHAAGQAYDTTSTAVVHAAEATGKAVVSGAQAASHAAERAGQAVGQTVVSGAKAVSHATERTYDAARDSVETSTRQAGEALEQAGKALERTGEAMREGASRAMDKLDKLGSWLSSQTGPMPLLNDGQHPGNGFYKQALAGLEKINAERGIPFDQRTCNAAGTLAASACESRFRQIDHVVLNDNGSKLIAVQGQPGAALSKVIDVDTVVALNTPLAQSSQAFAEAHNLQQNQRSQQVNRPVQAQTGPALA